MPLPDFLVEQDGEVRLVGSRIGLAHVVRAYQHGDTVEMIALRFPTLPLALIHKVIAYYLDNQAAIDAMVAHADAQLAELRQNSPAPSVAELRARLMAKHKPELAQRGD
jgi:uncharacterized protein (DUF433 family)